VETKTLTSPLSASNTLQHSVTFQAPNTLSSLSDGSIDLKIPSAAYSKILSELDSLEEITMQMYCYSKLEAARQTSSMPNKRRNTKMSRVWRLNVIIYGTVALEDMIGQHLSKNRVHLQDPVHCARDVLYRNPHMILYEDRLVTTEAFKSLPESVETEQLSVGPDLLAQLMKEQNPLPATEPPSIIKTSLYRYLLFSAHFEPYN